LTLVNERCGDITPVTRLFSTLRLFRTTEGVAVRWAHLLSMSGVWKKSRKMPNGLMALCGDDIELWPPHEPPLLGRTAVLAQMAHGTTRIHRIEITDCRIRGSNEIAYLTASYKTTFSSAEDSTPKQALGNHLWILRKQAGTWVITLVSWSLRAR